MRYEVTLLRATQPYGNQARLLCNDRRETNTVKNELGFRDKEATGD